MNVLFLVGSLAISGGTNVILQHATFLARQGNDVAIAVPDGHLPQAPAWHDSAHLLIFYTFQEAMVHTFDIVIATWWETSLSLHRFSANHHAYFVQSIESRFYPPQRASLRRLIDDTYSLPVAFGTEASWIASHLHDQYGQVAKLVRNGIRKDVYTLLGDRHAPRPYGAPRVLIEGPFRTTFKNTATAILLANEAGAKDVWVLTSSPTLWLPGTQRVFSQVPAAETASIYRSCDILLKLSTVEGMFGPPLEMFHCGGTAVVLPVSGHDEYIVDGTNALVAPSSDPNAIVSTVRKLLADKAVLSRLKREAHATANAWPDWTESSAKFSRWLDECKEARPTERVVLAAACEALNLKQAEIRGTVNVSPARRFARAAYSAMPRTAQLVVDTVRASSEVIRAKRILQ